MKDSDFTVVQQFGDVTHVSREPIQFTIVNRGEFVLPDGASDTLVDPP